jgi:thiamine biosynthesis lipoprotein
MRKPVIAGALTLVLSLAATAAIADEPVPENGAPLRVVRRSKPLFGAVVEALAGVESDEAARTTLSHFEAAFAEMKRVEQLLGDEGPESTIGRVNAAAGKEPVVVDPETFAVLTDLQRIAKLSNGAFDVTAAAYGSTWHFDDDAPSIDPASDAGVPEPRSVVPSKADVEKTRSLVGHEDLVLEGVARTAFLRRPGARIGLKALVRAYALDRAAAVLEGRGITGFILSAGGDLVVRGKKGDHPWMLGLQDPRAPGYFGTLTASPGAVMTTGDFEEFFFDGGVRYHHVLDPRTGLPANGCRSVTVVASDAVSGEALSRAVFVLGPKQGAAFIERLKGVDAVIVTNDNRVVVTKGLRGSLQYRPPTDGP